MSVSRRWWLGLSNCLTLALLVSVWVAFLPIQFGGQTAYVIVNGISMLPDYRRGDLVIARRTRDYQAGDAVIYHNAELGRYVFHRIIEADEGGFLLQGDNNTWVDTYRPTQAEILGKAWVHWPNAQRFTNLLKSPGQAALAASGLGGILIMLLFNGKSKGKKKSPSRRPGWNGFANLAAIGINLETLFLPVGMCLLLSMVLAFFAFTQPVQVEKPQEIPYQHTAEFAYTAQAPPGVYDSQTVQPEMPVFLKLSCTINFSYSYNFLSDQINKLSGMQSLSAEVSDDTGWRRSFVLQQAQPFVGSSTSAQATVDLCQVQAVVDSFKELTGVSRPGYQFSIIPVTEINGEFNGEAFQDRFIPELTFQFDGLHLWLPVESGQANPLKPSQEGSLQVPVLVTNQLSILSLGIPINSARLISLVAATLSLARLAVLYTAYSKSAHQDRAAHNRLKYGSMIVNIQGVDLEQPSQVIDVSSMDDLARIAERNEAMILHRSMGEVHDYLVQNDGSLYRFTLGKKAPLFPQEARARWASELRKALDQKEFQVYYQPVVSLRSGKILALEALLRWKHPEQGLLSAIDFVPAAESTEMIAPLDEWMLETACARVKAWQKELATQLTLTVNLSSNYVMSNSTTVIRKVLERTGLNPSNLTLDWPESKLGGTHQSILPRIHRLNDLGVKLSLDDFSGRVSLATLSHLPLTSVKIDRAIVDSLAEPKNVAMTRLTISAAHEMDLQVVAEGVETAQQLSALRSLHCDAVQGQLVCKPMPAGEVPRMLLANRGWFAQGRPIFSNS